MAEFGEPAIEIEGVRLVGEPASAWTQHTLDFLQGNRKVSEMVEYLPADNKIEGLACEGQAMCIEADEFGRAPMELRTPLLGKFKRNIVGIPSTYVVALTYKIDGCRPRM